AIGRWKRPQKSQSHCGRRGTCRSETIRRLQHEYSSSSHEDRKEPTFDRETGRVAGESARGQNRYLRFSVTSTPSPFRWAHRTSRNDAPVSQRLSRWEPSLPGMAAPGLRLNLAKPSAASVTCS